MGLPAEYGTGEDNICTDLRFSFQHHIQCLEDGDLLFFDNGNLDQSIFQNETNYYKDGLIHETCSGTPPMLHKINARCFNSSRGAKHAGINMIYIPGIPSRVILLSYI